MNEDLQYNVEIRCKQRNNDNDDDDEKQSNWKEVTILSNSKEYILNNLNNDKKYELRAKYKNNFGWSEYSEIVSFKCS